MGFDTVIVPSPRGESWVSADPSTLELTRARRVQGKVFRKHILNYGPLYHPQTGQVIRVDKQFVDTMRRNFDAGVCDIVQLPLANDSNKHVETPAANLGEVVGIEDKGGKVYALVDARQDAEKFGKTYLGASAFLGLNYKDSRTNRPAGPTLLHVAVTNRPYITNLEDYEPIAAAADGTGETAVFTQQEDAVPQSKEELLAALKDQHGIDVAALQAAASQQVDIAALSKALTDALGKTGQEPGKTGDGAVQLTADDQVTTEDLVGAVAELSRRHDGVTSTVAALRRERAEDKVDGYVRSGHVLPAQREFAVNLMLTRPDEFAQFLPAKPVVALANADGTGDGGPTGVAPPDEKAREHADGEVARLTASHKEFFGANGKAPANT
jgi:Mu-like prophage I protein